MGVLDARSFFPLLPVAIEYTGIMNENNTGTEEVNLWQFHWKQTQAILLPILSDPMPMDVSAGKENVVPCAI
jgi:hypothetical protein